MLFIRLIRRNARLNHVIDYVIWYMSYNAYRADRLSDKKFTVSRSEYNMVVAQLHATQLHAK